MRTPYLKWLLFLLISLILSSGAITVAYSSDDYGSCAIVEDLMMVPQDLTPEEWARVAACLKPVSISVEGSRCPYGTDDWGARCQATICARNYLGRILYCYNQRIDWRYDGSLITAIQGWNVWGWVGTICWEYVGEHSSYTRGGKGQSYFERWTQGYFRCCVPVIGCLYHDYPTLDMTVYGDGGCTWR